MKLTYFGHSCFTVETNGVHIMFDPFISPNPLAAEIDTSKLNIDYILISHGHVDHVADAVSFAKQTGATVVSNWEIIQWIKSKGIDSTHPMNIGGQWKFDFGSVKCVNAVHSSGLPDGANGGNPMGFLIETDRKNFYYSGDTALNYDMKLIGEYRKIDFALLPIGDNFTMGIDNAIIASDFIGCNKIIGLHYDTFGYIKINHEEAVNKFSAAGKELILMPIGETIQL